MDWMQSTWFWWGMALALFAAEALLPGAFMLWFGFAAAACGLLHLLFPEISLFAQWVLFCVFALLSVGVGWRFRAARNPIETDQPLLNKRAEQLLDKVYPLETAISNGRGRVKIGDAFWSVEGDDLPVGTRVRVVAVQGLTLRVHPAE